MKRELNPTTALTLLKVATSRGSCTEVTRKVRPSAQGGVVRDPINTRLEKSRDHSNEHTSVLVKVLCLESIDNWSENKRSNFSHCSSCRDSTDLVHDAFDKFGCLAVLGELEVYCKNSDGFIY